MSRKGDHQINSDLVSTLRELNKSMKLAEVDAVGVRNKTEYPTIFIVGAPRAGTTLMMQWLADTGHFAYPTNLISRFYTAPYLGSIIQNILTDKHLDYQDELYDLKASESNLESRLGKTKGFREPNGFWYMWRRFIPITEIRKISKKDEIKVDRKGLMNAVASLEKAADKPVLLKGKMMQFNLDILTNVFKKSLVIFIKREEKYNIESILRARVEYNGDIGVWFGAKPSNFEEIKRMDPISQVVGQVRGINNSISQQLNKIDIVNRISISYEDLCNEPKMAFIKICDKINSLGYEVNSESTKVRDLNNRNGQNINPDFIRNVEIAV
jgi:LPS sulfotransferase NodH